MYEVAIPMQKAQQKRAVRARRAEFNAERALDIYYAVLTIVILGMIVGIGAYAVHTVLPALQKSHSSPWQRSHAPKNMGYPMTFQF